jgi:hypothetical protein
MASDLMDTGCTKDEEPSSAPEGIPAERVSAVSLPPNPPCGEMSFSVLTAQCLEELDHYCRGEPFTQTYGLELLRRATIRGDQEAWAWVQHCFGGMVRGWLRRHSKREVACRLEGEETYVAQAFERFWQATAFNQQVEFSTLAAALQYLRASLNGAILDTLRADARPREVSLPGPGEPGEPLVEEESTDTSEVWEILRTMLSNNRERRLAYLLYHCSLKPREIVRFCPQEWSDVQEIYRLRRNILERVLRNADQLRWQFPQEEENDGLS